MVVFNGSKQLEAWLKDKPREVAIAIGVHAALRAAPLAAEYVANNPATNSATLIFPIFRAVAAPWFADTWPNQGASDIAFSALSAARSAAWATVAEDATVVETSGSADALMRSPLWTGGVPDNIREDWNWLKVSLLALDEDWWVWTDWYEDRLYGSEHGRPLIEELERGRVLIPDADWDKGPKHVNALIADLEAEFRAKTPPQRAAIIQVAYGPDDKLHLVSPPPPRARDDAQANRQRAAWVAHSERLAALENVEPGRNLPSFGHALEQYRAALGATFEAMNVSPLACMARGSTPMRPAPI